MPWPDPRPLRILVIRYRFIGDTVLAIPALRNLREAFPHATIEVLVEPIAGDTLTHCPYIDGLVYHLPNKKHRWIGRSAALSDLQTAFALRRRRYDRCYILRRSFSSAVIPFLAGIPHRVGFGTEFRQWMLQRATPYDPAKHEVECFLDIVRADGIPVASTHNENWSAPAEDAAVQAKLPRQNRRRVLLAARSSNATKEWPDDRFAAVIEWLIREANCEIHVCDAPKLVPSYAPIRAALSSDSRDHWHDWSELPMRHAGSLVRHMDFYLGVDTGMAHIAASFHVPTVVLIDPRAVSRWHPWDTAYELVCPTPDRPDDLRTVSTTAVIDALKRIFEKATR